MKYFILALSIYCSTAFGLASCRDGSADTVVNNVPMASTVVGTTVVEPTAVSPLISDSGKHLTICMSQEPSSLYWYGRETVFEEAVLHAIYENDITTLSYGFQPQGLESIPNLAHGDASFRIVPVDAGDRVIDANGNVATLAPGIEVITADDELTMFEGSTLLMRQLVVDFLMKQRYWADGHPVTAADSVYSFRLAAHPDTPVDKFKTTRTASYQATGNLSVRWAGLPGFEDTNYQTNYYHPLPQHIWTDLSEADLLTAEISSQLPLGDGPFQIVEWLPGESIRLESNPFYYRAQESLPRLNGVTFRFVRNSNERISQLLAGQCQIITHDRLNLDLIPFFLEAQDANLLNTSIRPGSSRWQISFGINSWGDYGDGVGRPDWFEDARVRQAFAMCINRQQIADITISSLSPVPHSYLPSIHPLHTENTSRWPFDLAAANNLLNEAGYLDTNLDRTREDPLTGEDFRVSLITGEDRTERQIAQMIKEYLQECGIEIVIEPQSDQQRYASVEENRVQRRRFDLALAMAPADHMSTCDQFASWQVSGPESEQNRLTGGLFAGWRGKNHSGWSDPAYDAACAAALNAIPGEPNYALNHEQAQTIFSQNLPVLPLFFSPRITATVPEIPYINNDPSQISELWNLFALDLVK